MIAFELVSKFKPFTFTIHIITGVGRRHPMDYTYKLAAPRIVFFFGQHLSHDY